MCPGDKLVLTCVFSGNQVFWVGPGTHGTATLLYNNILRVIGSFNISVIIKETNGVLTATNEPAPLSLDGAVAKCGASLFLLDSHTIHIAGYYLTVTLYILIITCRSTISCRKCNYYSNYS